ncbi:MAG: carboxypeptidase-like regulatory domain-containing protein [Dysgonamonadaceae bacterium]|jgi:hypothetical protein|nr:carboxypeptidase-like regulatory domain-containing protein [Dysgonamonadaceae bacterium]
MNTKTYIILLFAYLSTPYMFSQLRITGRVMDEETNLAIDAANVLLLKTDSTFVKGTACDPDGKFDFSNVAKASYLVSISSLGYSKVMITLENLEKSLNLEEIKLSPEAITLNEVTVTAEASTVKYDKKIFFPTQSQVKTSPSAFQLLEKLQLPRITINPVNRSISSLGGGNVQIRVNNVEVPLNEIQSLQSNDLIRVEYIDEPGARYGGETAVVLNFITRRKNSGGSFFVNMNNSLLQKSTLLDNVVSAKYNHKKSEWTLNLNGRNVNTNWTRENEERFYFPDYMLVRKEKGEPTKYKEDNLNASLNYSLSDPEKYFFNAVVRNSFQSVPNSFSDRISVVEGTVASDKLNVYSHTEGEINIPVLDLYYQRMLKNKQSLIFNLVGTNNHSDITRIYQESKEAETLTDIYSKTVGNRYSLILEGLYEKDMSAGGMLMIGAKHIQSYTDNDYSGTSERTVDMTLAETYLYSEYILSKGKFSYRLGLGIQRNELHQGLFSTERYIFRPALRISYAMTSNSFIRYNGNISNNSPSLSSLNDVEQQMDSFQIRRGNPALYMIPVYNNSLSTGFKKGILNMELFSTLRYEHRPVLDKLFIENNKFISTYANQGYYMRLDNYLTVKLVLFNRHVSLSLTPGVNRFISQGDDYRHTLTNWYYRTSVWGYYKDFSLTFGMYSYNRLLTGENVDSGEKAHFFSLSYNRPKYSIGIWAFNPFSTYYEQYTENLSSKLPSYSRLYTNELSRFFTLTASIHFDFGRKFKSQSKKLENVDNERGTLTGNK